MKTGSRIGVDANLITYSEWRRINKEIKYKGINLVPLDTNLIDRMWSDRPAIPSNPVKPLNIKFTGIINHCFFNQRVLIIIIYDNKPIIILFRQKMWRKGRRS